MRTKHRALVVALAVVLAGGGSCGGTHPSDAGADARGGGGGAGHGGVDAGAASRLTRPPELPRPPRDGRLPAELFPPR